MSTPLGITLSFLYADANIDTKQTDVYANGKMQMSVFPTANYNGTAPLEEVKAYIAKNTQIYVLGSSGDETLLGWKRSSIPNEYLHDMKRGGLPPSSTSGGNVLRVPIYFTVPVKAAGDYLLIAELDGVKTLRNAAVTVTVHTLSVEPSYFEFAQVGHDIGKAKLQALRYVGGFLPSDAHRLLRVASHGYKNALKLASTNVHVTMIGYTLENEKKKRVLTYGAFVDNSACNVDIGKPMHAYGPWYYTIFLNYSPSPIEDRGTGDVDLTSSVDDAGWSDPKQFTTEDLESASTQGIAVVNVKSINMLNQNNYFQLPGYNVVTVRDTFGNSIDLHLDTTTFDEDDFGVWKITDTTVVYPKD